MTIVASNNITVSNVNDGTITHIAYAYSADGTNGFTTVYPNLNLLKNTKSQSYTSTGTANNNSSNFYTLDDSIVLGKPLTITYDYSITNSSGTWSGVIRPTYGLGGTNQSVSNTNLSGTHREVLNSYDSNAKSCGILTSGLPTGTTVTITNLKVEFGSTATPHMPSTSEVKTSDYPIYRGEYSDYSSTASTDPSKYSWGLIKGNDSYTHTAYSWSADGKDGFTTVYPNLNLLSDTTFKNYTPLTNQYLSMAIKDGGVNNKPYVSVSYNNPTENTYTDTISWGFNKEYFKPSTAYTFSFYLRGNGTIRTHVYPSLIDTSSVNGIADGKVIRPNSDGNYDWNLTSEWVRHTYTFITKSSITATQNFLFRIFTGNSADICLPKVEEGLTATPWMPSSSEVKTSDYPNYIGTYSDSNVESSLEYSKYQWAIFKGQNSNAYTAYSWSSDGTDRFSTIYPNLNLLKGTKTPTSITGNNTANQGGLLYPFDNDKTLANQGFNINDILTLEFDWSATNPSSGYFILQWQGVPWGFSLPTINISSTNSSGHVVYAFNVRDKDIASTAYATGIGYRLDNIPTNTVITFSNVIIRKAKGSQPWMPSESEAQDQWQDAIPMYIGVGEKDSQNPSDYRWQLNPRYVQASSDSGLSNKAGVDDLASVADTANDALVQAQNAVSNEDYTSWLEHDYQSTINNLQDVSTKNQEDIKNVDDRTTIVEGFYGGMKVKWNFIDESFSFSEEGMFISNAQSKMSIQITSDKIVFWDNNVDVAFITGEVLNIQKGVFLESATIGNHLITKFSDDSPVTIIRYVGGIT